MKLKATIRVIGDAKKLKTLFLAENCSSNNDRAEFKTEVSGKDFLINIQASDSTAFRAIINSISKIITVYEKTLEVIADEK